MNCPKISVIIPVYNVEKYLEDCLDSILNQSLISDLEVIMVDDGSDDDSGYIMEKYAFEHENFHAYHKKNEGQGIGRNYGLRLAKGEYVHFMDADDFLAPDAHEKLYDFAKVNDNDFVMCDVSKFSQHTIWTDIIFRNCFRHITENIKSTNIKILNDLVWDTISVNKLFKREFLVDNNIQFINEKIYFEDMLFSFNVHYLADSVGILNEKLYFWKIRPDNSSVTQSLNTEATFNNRFVILKKINDFLIDNVSQKELLRAQYLKWLNHDFMIYLKRIGEFAPHYQKVIADTIKSFLKFIPNELKSNLNGYNQVMYYFVENDDLENLVLYSHQSTDLIEDIQSHNIYKIFNSNFDFNKGYDYAELVAEMVNCDIKDEYLILDINLYIPYMPKSYTNLVFELIGDNVSHKLEYEGDNEIYQIFIPLDLINQRFSIIKVIYEDNKNKFKDKSDLRTTERFVFNCGDSELNIIKAENRQLMLYSRKLNESDIVIDDIEFLKDYIEFHGTCRDKFDSAVIENLMDLYKISYDADFKDNGFSVRIPLNDLIRRPVKKWEFKLDSPFKSVSVNGDFEFFDKNSHFKFHNQRNRVVITVSDYDVNEIVGYYKNKTKQLPILKRKNQELSDENKELKDKLLEFESQNEAKFVDKLRKFI